ncbi:SWEET family sugar transporter [Campylobacter concisus]|uniref:SWEET family sugar transporter n=1 Tax=Campylobacter concisus TaxID=199 RepID=UPI00214D3B58|nr:SWEET family sugar transporter [Campylobacter concisus]
MSEKNLQILGWIGTCLSVVMYFSYIPQIMGNLDGNKTPFIQPLAAALNCTIWTSYGLLKAKKRLSTFCRKLPRYNLWSFGYNNSVLMR